MFSDSENARGDSYPLRDGDSVRSNPSEPALVRPFSIVVVCKEEIDSTIRPVHVARTVPQALHPANTILELREETVKLVKIVPSHHYRLFE